MKDSSQEVQENRKLLKRMLTKTQIQYLKTCAHDKKPVVIVGSNGFSDGVIKEIDSSLSHHELMKIKVNGLNKENKDSIAAEICSKVRAETVQILGSIITVFRQNKKGESNYVLPKD
jgi:RNA-binding protein